NWLFIFASILLLLALPAMYARQAGASSWLGLAGYALLQAGILLVGGGAAPPPVMPAVAPALRGNGLAVWVGGPRTPGPLRTGLSVGLLVTGLATASAGVYPRGVGILLLAATAGFFFDFFVAEFLPPIAGQAGSALFGALLALALAWAGLFLVTG